MNVRRLRSLPFIHIHTHTIWCLSWSVLIQTHPKQQVEGKHHEFHAHLASWQRSHSCSQLQVVTPYTGNHEQRAGEKDTSAHDSQWTLLGARITCARKYCPSPLHCLHSVRQIDLFIYLFLSQFLQEHVVYIARFTLRHGLFEYLPLIKKRWSYYALLKTAAHQLSSLHQRQKPFRWRHLPVSVCFDNNGGIVN